MDSFEAKVSAFIDQNKLPDRGSRIIIGFSGGADSTALVAVLKALDYECMAAHCNFQLRGDESIRDESHAISIARQLGIPIETIHFDVSAYIVSQARPISVEMACRELRYDWFEQLRTTHSAKAIAVGHHAEDNAETMLLNLIRGTGLTGARGMLPQTNRYIIRPLLETTRAEIEDYLTRKNLSFVIDSTNRESVFSRNKLRNDTLASLYGSFPNAINGFTSSLKHLRQAETFLNKAAYDRMSLYADHDGNVHIRKLLDSEPEAEFLVFQHLRQFGLNHSQISDIISSADTSGKRFFNHNGYFYTDRGILRWAKNENISTDLDDYYTITEHTLADFKPSKNRDEIYVDAKVLAHGPLTVRFWRKGDRIRPFGMNGSKAVSDIFSDAKIPLGHKHKIPLLCVGDTILWVTGIRASSLYHVTDKTKSFLRIKYSPR